MKAKARAEKPERGIPTAQLLAAEQRMTPAEAVKTLDELSKRNRLGGIPLRELIHPDTGE